MDACRKVSVMKKALTIYVLTALGVLGFQVVVFDVLQVCRFNAESCRPAATDYLTRAAFWPWYLIRGFT